MMTELAEARGRCWAEIDLDVLCGNYRRAVALSAPARVICVLKANAYGLGLVPVCRALREAGATLFAVASASEAEQLLEAFPDIDVLILGLVPEASLGRLICRRAILTLFSVRQGRAILNAAEQVGIAARVHVKLDTGLHRIGFFGPDAAEEIAALCARPQLNAEGLYTHLALHDAEDDVRQFAEFDAQLAELERRGLRFDIVHMCDSIGMVRYPKRHMDAVRIGAWLYGVCPNRYEHPEQCVLPVRFMTRIAQLRTVKAGERVGYDDDHFLPRDTRIATLSAGYADGSARLCDVGEVEIRGRRAPVKGLVCMDQMMVDVSDIPDVAEGDEVTLLGGTIGINEYAAWGRQNRNESLSRLTPRCVRVYTWGNRTWTE